MRAYTARVAAIGAMTLRQLAETLQASRIAVIAVCGSKNQNLFFWPTYRALEPGIAHDLIVVHRNGSGLPPDTSTVNAHGRVILLDKLLADGRDVPHRAFGAYRFAFSRHRSEFDLFVFLTDHTSLRRAGWLAEGVQLLALHPRLGFGASQLFNGNDGNASLRTRYPHESHVRAPGPLFVKRACLERIRWQFRSDHEAEMTFARKLVREAGCIGLQVGNKLNLGFDTLGDPPLLPLEEARQRSNYQHVTHQLEARYFPNKRGIEPFHPSEFHFFEELLAKREADGVPRAAQAEVVISPFRHIGVQRVFYDLQPFNDLLYAPSLELARQQLGERAVRQVGGNVYVLRRQGLTV